MGALYGRVDMRAASLQCEVTNRSLRHGLSALSSVCGGGGIALLADGENHIAYAEPRQANRPLRTPRLASHGNGRFVLAFDGWLGDRVALAAALNHDLGGKRNDAGLAAAALLHWGDGAFARLHGNYALAWLDQHDHRLLIACDREGGNTLFFHQNDSPGSSISFASTASILLADPDIPREIDSDAIASTAMWQAWRPGRTCLRGIRQLPPAHFLELTRHGTQLTRYWQLDPHRQIYFRRDQDYVDCAREILDRAVADALPEKGPFVSMLSGGLDSSAVAATVARLIAPNSLVTITMRPHHQVMPVRPQSWFNDEWEHAQATASLYDNIRAEHFEAPNDPPDSILRADMPLNGRFPLSLLSKAWFDPVWRRARALGATSVIGGRAGNSTLSASGYDAYNRPIQWADTSAALSNAWRGLRHTRLPARIPTILKRLVPEAVLQKLRAMISHPQRWRDFGAFTSHIAESTQIEAIFDAHTLRGAPVPFVRRYRVYAMEFIWDANALSAPLRFSRGVDYRDPLGDVRLAEFCMAIPPSQLIRGRVDRYLARRVLADRLPAMVLNERRRGRQTPEWLIWMNQLRPWIAQELERMESSPTIRAILDLKRMRHILDNWPVDQRGAEQRYRELMEVLGGGVAIGMFVNWVEGRND